MDPSEKIQRIIAEECFLKPEDITAKALFAELGVNSLAQIQIWMRIGQEFDIEMPDADSTFWADHPVHDLSEVLTVVEQLKQIHAAPVLTANRSAAGQ